MSQESETPALPAVSVIIPLHNHEKWVNNALDSVLTQSYPNKRIVVVNDGSTDGSLKKVVDRLYRPRGPEKQGEPWVCQGKARPNMDTDVMVCSFSQAHGPSFARNWGVKVSWEGSDAFCFLDSDDYYMPNKIARSVAKWQEQPDYIGAVYSDYDTLGETGLRLRQYKEPFSRMRLIQECLVNCDSLVSKRAFSVVGLFDEELRTCEDYDLWMRISEHFLIVHLPEPLLTIRVGSHSSSSTIAREAWQKNWNRVMAKAKSRNV
jgi:glycosyltransferase involved in cell wall biosynthesis